MLMLRIGKRLAADGHQPTSARTDAAHHARGAGFTVGAAALWTMAAMIPSQASSHMDAPLITLEPAANTTDVYAFVSTNTDPGGGQAYLTTALAVYPFEQPGIGPNLFRFDDNVVYDINLALDNNISKGLPDITYRFTFSTTFKNNQTILTYLGLVQPAANGVFPDNQNMRQTYTVTMIDQHNPRATHVIGQGIVPPNNQGRVTKYYNQGDDGDQQAKLGAATTATLDPYTQAAIFRFNGGYRVFAGQREDGFFADVQSVFDLDFGFGRDRNTPTKPYDSQAGFNVHAIVLDIPLSALPGTKIAGVYATTSHRSINGQSYVPSDPRAKNNFMQGQSLIQVGRQGNPLFNEVLVAEVDKDLYNQTSPNVDASFFAKYADNPEVARALGTTPIIPGLLHSIFIPDMIKVDLTTGPARLAGSVGFNRLGVFGGDVLHSTVQAPFANGGFIPGGWPNGRRFGDDVVNIALIALGAAGPFGSPGAATYNGDRVNHNDTTYNSVFPYAGTPVNGRNIPAANPAAYGP